MQLADVRNPSERNKLILAAALGLIALVFLWWTFFGFGGGGSKVASRPTTQPTPSAVSRRPTTAPAQSVIEFKGAELDQLRPVLYQQSTITVPDARRNIFIFYEKLPPPIKETIVPTPTPTPTPPILLASLSPANVYAQTAAFTLEISGDKLTPQLRVVIDNSNELPTRYINPQQLSATVPANLIANPGVRQVMLRSADGQLYSNSASLSIAAPPTPNYTYIGIIGTVKWIDTAILQDKSNKETLNVQRGDLLAGRFRVTSISEKEVVVVDNNLKVKHTLAMSSQGDRGNPMQRPTPRVDSEDDEP